MSNCEQKPSFVEQQPTVPTWILGVTAILACYMAMIV